jgi:hypothetical protein
LINFGIGQITDPPMVTFGRDRNTDEPLLNLMQAIAGVLAGFLFLHFASTFLGRAQKIPFLWPDAGRNVIRDGQGVAIWARGKDQA